VDGPAPGHAEGQGAGELDEASDLAHHCVLYATTGTKEPGRWFASGAGSAPCVAQGGQ
jgi:hypothetical protein